MGGAVNGQDGHVVSLRFGYRAVNPLHDVAWAKPGASSEDALETLAAQSVGKAGVEDAIRDQDEGVSGP